MSAAASMRRGRPRSTFTDEVLATIPVWVEVFNADRHVIASALGTTVGSLQVVCSKHGISLGDARNGVRYGLGRARWERLWREAEDRGLSVAQLILDVLTQVVDDNLFEAVLDDEEDN